MLRQQVIQQVAADGLSERRDVDAARERIVGARTDRIHCVHELLDCAECLWEGSRTVLRGYYLDQVGGGSGKIGNGLRQRVGCPTEFFEKGLEGRGILSEVHKPLNRKDRFVDDV